MKYVSSAAAAAHITEEHTRRLARLASLLVEREVCALPRSAERVAQEIIGKTPDQIRAWWRRQDGTAEYAEKFVECVRDAA